MLKVSPTAKYVCTFGALSYAEGPKRYLNFFQRSLKMQENLYYLTTTKMH